MAAAPQQPAEMPVRRLVKADWMDLPPPAAPALPVPLVNGMCAVVEKHALHVGGFRPTAGTCVNSTAEFDLTTRVWSSVGVPPFPCPISEGGMVGVNNAYYVYGGWNGAEVLGDVYTLPLQGASGEARGGAWSCVYKSPQRGSQRRPAGLHPRPRRGPSVAAGVLNERPVIFVFGGFSGTRRLNDLWAFAVQDKVWICIRTPGSSSPTPRDGAAMAFDALSQRLILFGGYDDAPTNCLFELPLDAAAITVSEEAEHTVDGMEWALLRSVRPPMARHGCFAAVCGHFFVVGFGQDAEGPSKLLFQLDLTDGCWTVCSTDGEETATLDARWGAAFGVAADGKRVLAFGGAAADGRYLTSSLDIELERSEPQAKGKR